LKSELQQIEKYLFCKIVCRVEKVFRKKGEDFLFSKVKEKSNLLHFKLHSNWPWWKTVFLESILRSYFLPIYFRNQITNKTVFLESILRSYFLPIYFRNQITNTNYKVRLEKLRKNTSVWKKTARKMLMKLAPSYQEATL